MSTPFDLVSLPFDQGVSTFWSASDTDFKHLCLGVSTFWSGCLWLWFPPSFHQDVSAFWSTSDTDFKNLSPNSRCGCLHLGEEHLLQPCGCLCLLISKWHFKNLSLNFHWWGVVSIFWSTSDTDIKNLSLGVYTFWSGCFHLLMRVPLLLISKSHWLQKPKFQHSPGGLSPPFDQQVTLTSKT